MVFILHILATFGFLVETGSFILPTTSGCSVGCHIQISPLNGGLHCDCSHVPAKLQRNSEHLYHVHHHNHTTHIHTTHPHYLHGHNHKVTHALLPLTSSVTAQPLSTVTSLCEVGWKLVVHPEGWNYCQYPTSTITSTTREVISNTVPQPTTETTTEAPTSHLDTTAHALTNDNSSMETTHTKSTLLTTLLSVSASHQQSTTIPTIPTKSTTTTENICVLLCALQQGGDACNCSKPGLPG